MAKIDDGEFELVLGNRQLFTAFFVVVALFAVFFGMGFLIGKNTAREDAAEKASQSVPSPERVAANAASRPSPAGPTPAESRKELGELPGEASTPASMQKPAGAAPADLMNKIPPPPPEPPKTASSAKPTAPAGAAQNAGKPPVTAPAAAGLREAPPGRYVQVAAVKMEEATVIQELLQRKGFSAVLAPAPTGGLVRVLTGPYPDSAAQSRDRAKLVEIGFRGAFFQQIK